MENQAPPWDVPLADRRGGFQKEMRLEMLARAEYNEGYNQMYGIVYNNIFAVPWSRWEAPQKVVENNRAGILRDFEF